MMVDAIELIRLADSADEVMRVLLAYGQPGDALRDAAALPQWWLQLPLADAGHALKRLFALEAIVNAASQQLDERRRRAGKRALQVFAAGVWKLNRLTRQGVQPHNNVP